MKEFEDKSKKIKLSYLDILVLEPDPVYKIKKYRSKKGPREILREEEDSLNILKEKDTLDLLNNPQNLEDMQKEREKKFYETVKNNFKDLECSKNKKKEDDELFVENDFDLIDWESEVNKQYKRENIPYIEVANEIFNEEKFEEKLILDKNSLKEFKPYPEIYLNDPYLYFKRTDDNLNNYDDDYKINTPIEESIKWKYNISKDEYYEYKVKVGRN